MSNDNDNEPDKEVSTNNQPNQTILNIHDIREVFLN